MELLSPEGARQSKAKPGSFRPRIIVAWWVSDELKCCLWTVLDAWKSPLGSWWQHSWVVAAYSSKCRQCLTIPNVSPILTEGQMDPESSKNHLKESAFGAEKKKKDVVCVLPGWPEWCLGGFCCCCSSWSLQAGLVWFLAQFSLLSVWIFSWWAERSWFTLGTTRLWSQQQMPDAAGIQRNNESNPKCESAVGVMGVPPLLCLSLAFLAPSTLSALVSAPCFSSCILPPVSFPFVSLFCLLPSSYCPLLCHDHVVGEWCSPQW